MENLDYRVGTNLGACGRKYRWVQTGGGGVQVTRGCQGHQTGVYMCRWKHLRALTQMTEDGGSEGVTDVGVKKPVREQEQIQT